MHPKLLHVIGGKEYKHGRFLFTEEIKKRRRILIVAPENIDAVLKLIIQKSHRTYHDMATMDIAYTRFFTCRKT